jgi:hypothetical protein
MIAISPAGPSQPLAPSSRASVAGQARRRNAKHGDNGIVRRFCNFSVSRTPRAFLDHFT